jgi:DMSO/TMAO reductase YedYZ molybdopterin-dependent catalytic subunit
VRAVGLFTRRTGTVDDPLIPVGRRVFLGITALGGLGVLLGAKVQSGLSAVLGNSALGLFPGGDNFRIYSVSGTLPAIAPNAYRLNVTGLVDQPTTFTLADLEAMAPTRLTRDFQCVTGWRVPDVAWEGVRLGDVLDAVGVKKGAVAVSFDSYDGTDTESLTLAQARRPDVLVAHRMLGGPITTEHGGPVRLYVAPMFGYKSIKWLSGIRVVDRVEPGYWEQRGYPVNGWIDGSTADNNSSAS